MLASNYPYPLHKRSLEIKCKKILNTEYEAKLNFPKGRMIQTEKKTFLGDTVDIFQNNTTRLLHLVSLMQSLKKLAIATSSSHTV